MSPPLWSLDACELNARYARRELSPVDVAAAALSRLHEMQPLLNAVVASDAEAALQSAQGSEARWRRGEPLSPLDGIPLTVKDNIPVAGLPCTWGSALYRGHRPTRDELPVARLRAAGAVILGKTNVPEFTLHGYTANALFGVTRNPWAPALTPGGSSGGAVAAVASGIGPLALATDGGGSIRRPAGHTGLVGLKPTAGRVERRDGLPALLMDFEVIGPVARRVRDLCMAMPVIAPGFGAAGPVRPQRILRVHAIGGSPVDPVIDAALDLVSQRLRALGHEVASTLDLPLADTVNREVWPVVSAAGLAWVLRAFPDSAQVSLGAPVAALAQAGRDLTAVDLVAAFDRIREAREALADLHADWDVLLMPTAAAMPWAADRTHPESIGGRPVGPRGHAVFTAFVNATGVPALALPAPRSPQGLPIGFQLVGAAGSDETLCALGEAYEAEWPWAQDWPGLG